MYIMYANLNSVKHVKITNCAATQQDKKKIIQTTMQKIALEITVFRLA